MYNNSIHDIKIDKNIKTKSGKPIFAVIIIVIILASISYGIYYYLNFKNKETDKELFLKGLANADLEFFLEDETYSGIGEKISNNNFESNSDITFSTNIISITDGQIVLSSKSFLKGQKPAIDYGVSVSRLGGAVQTSRIKKLGASVRLKLLNYLETR